MPFSIACHRAQKRDKEHATSCKEHNMSGGIPPRAYLNETTLVDQPPKLAPWAIPSTEGTPPLLHNAVDNNIPYFANISSSLSTSVPFANI